MSPEWSDVASPLFRELLVASAATHIEAQTNMALMATIILECAHNISAENVLFRDGPATELGGRGLEFRRRVTGDAGPEGEWVIESEGKVVAAGGILSHYNPPYVDIYMEVVAAARRKGIGAYLVQELRRVCRKEGTEPAARCDPSNEASRRTLERGGMVTCGRLVAGEVKVCN